MLDQFSRTTLLLGKERMQKLYQSRVAVFGIGGVGGYCAEALARSGVGRLSLFDDDRICLTNINRQIIASRSTIGRYKVEVMRERILDINPGAGVEARKMFYTRENADFVNLSAYDYVVDAVDTMTAKLELAVRAEEGGVPIISSMGAANKLDPTAFEVADIYETSVCPLARVMRRELRRRGVEKLKVVYSKEAPLTPIEDESNSCALNCVCPPDVQRKCDQRRQVPASNAFVPPVAGLILAGEVVKDLSAGAKGGEGRP
ncbi:MAG: tRNA threonylcarbamoyladenosine dehydratase [Christensenellaceae bacterium]|jgi:tRNA A37 threonylcarbamoyladenosine dehydratase|nr:tRNA threonylcarbamoyladenosine dehydratase [Christensenellaceae bacterium]